MALHTMTEKLGIVRELVRARWSLRRATLGHRVRALGPIYVHPYGTIRIGDKCRIGGRIAPTELGTGSGGVLDIGVDVFVNYGTSISAIESVTIGDHTMIGSHSIINDGDFHDIHPDRRNEPGPVAPVVLEQNVWLGNRVIVQKGVTIGENSVVAAGSVVTKSIPANQLWGGVPAGFLRDL